MTTIDSIHPIRHPMISEMDMSTDHSGGQWPHTVFVKFKKKYFLYRPPLARSVRHLSGHEDVDGSDIWSIDHFVPEPTRKP